MYGYKTSGGWKIPSEINNWSHKPVWKSAKEQRRDFIVKKCKRKYL